MKGKYGTHKYDRHFSIKYGKRQTSKTKQLRTCFIRLMDRYLYSKMGMSKKLVKSKIWKYMSDRSQKELEIKVQNMLERVRSHVEKMIDEKAQNCYTNLYLCDTIIAANLCYEFCKKQRHYGKYYYYYGTVKPDSKNPQNERFIMSYDDHIFKNEWVWKDSI